MTLSNAMRASLPFLALTLLLSAAPVAAQAPSVDGAWTLSWTTPRGEETFELALEQSGSAFTGMADGSMGEVPVKDGVIEGDSITFTMELTMGRPGGQGGQGRTIVQTFSGVFTDDGVEGEIAAPAMGGRGGGGGGGAGGARGGGGPQGPRTFTMVRVEG